MTKKATTANENSDPPMSPAACQVQHDADGERPHRDHEGPALAPSHPPGQGQEPDPHQGHQGARRLTGDVGEQFEHEVETSPERRRHGGEHVDHTRHGDGACRPTPHPPGPVADRAQVRGGGPRGPAGVRGHDHRMGVVHLALTRRHALEQRGSGELGSREQEAGVELGTGLELHPRQLLAGQEDREQAQAPVGALRPLPRPRPGTRRTRGRGA